MNPVSTQFQDSAFRVVADECNEGIMFDLKAKKQTTVHGFSTVFNTAGTVDRVEIYCSEGRHAGSRVFAGTVYYTPLTFPWPKFLPGIINRGN